LARIVADFTNFVHDCWFAGKQADAHVVGDGAMLEHEVNSMIYYGRGEAAQLVTGLRCS